MLNFFKNFFKDQSVKKADIPFLHEAIDVKSYPLIELLEWQNSGKWDEVTSMIQKAYSDRLITGKSQSGNVSILNSSHANGWLIHCANATLSDIDYKHLAYLLYSKVKMKGYTLNLSEVKSQERSPNIETITKYYLKPSLRNRFINDDNLAGQLYGNITISYKVINGKPFEFKFEAHAYRDSKYTEPLDFSDLLDSVLGV